MNNRQRVNLAINHKNPDKVPVSLGIHICDGFTKFAKDNYEKYVDEYGCLWEPYC